MLKYAIPGFFGRVLRMDLTRRTVLAVTLPPELLRIYPGGPGLACRLLLAAANEPDSEAAGPALVLASCPLVDTGIATSARCVVSGRSPQTGVLGESLISSGFAIALRRSGWDAVILTGRSPEPAVAMISPSGAELSPLDSKASLGAAEIEAWVATRFGPSWSTVAAGPAARAGVAFAGLSHRGRHAGRTGLGALLAAMNVFGIAILGDRSPPAAHPALLREMAHTFRQRASGPATARYRRLGTASNTLTFARLGILPVRNFTSALFLEAEAITGEEIALSTPRVRSGCRSCIVQCEYRYQAGGSSVRAEYESLWALGPNLGLSDPGAVLAMIDLCDQAGVDTISAGGTLAWAVECMERGVLAPHELDGLHLRWGDAPGLTAALQSICARSGAAGELLSGGVRRAAELLGRGSDYWAAHVKGLELPGYDPRPLPCLALGLAVGARGACHNRSSGYDADLSPDPPADQVDALIETEDRSSILDTTGICKFLRHSMPSFMDDAAELLQALTGDDWDGDAVRLLAGRIASVRRAFNYSLGAGPELDTLPPRLLCEPLPDGPRQGASLSPHWLSERRDLYYRRRGWSEAGTPALETQELELPGQALRDS